METVTDSVDYVPWCVCDCHGSHERFADGGEAGGRFGMGNSSGLVAQVMLSPVMAWRFLLLSVHQSSDSAAVPNSEIDVLMLSTLLEVVVLAALQLLMNVLPANRLFFPYRPVSPVSTNYSRLQASALTDVMTMFLLLRVLRSAVAATSGQGREAKSSEGRVDIDVDKCR